MLSAETLRQLAQLRRQSAGKANVQIVISEGLNALALMDAGQLAPFLEKLQGDAQPGGLQARGREYCAHIRSCSRGIPDRRSPVWESAGSAGRFCM